MGKSFFGRLLPGLASSAVAQVIGSLNALLLVPLFIRAWGADGYGRWLALTALAQYLSLTDFGGQSYVGNLLAQKYVDHDEMGFRRVLSEGVSLFTLLSAGVLVTTLAVLFVIPLGVLQSYDLSDRLVIALTGALLLTSVPAGVYVSAYRATGLFARGTMVGNVMRGLSLVLSAVLLYLAVSPVLFAAAALAHGITMTSVVIWDTRRKIPGCRDLRLRWEYAKHGAAYLRESLVFWLISLSTAVSQQGVLLVLAALSSPLVVAAYSTHRAVAGLLRYVTGVLQGPLWAEFSLLWAGKRLRDIERVLVVATGLAVLAAGIVAIWMYGFLPYVYPLWTGKQLQLDPPLVALMLVQGVLAGGYSASNWALLATNHHRSLSIWALSSSAGTVLGAALLYGYLGPRGVALALLVADGLSGALVLPLLASRSLGTPAPRTYRALLVCALGLALVAAGSVLSTAYLPRWLTFGTVILLSGMSLVVCGYLLAGRREMERVFGRLVAPLVGQGDKRMPQDV